MNQNETVIGRGMTLYPFPTEKEKEYQDTEKLLIIRRGMQHLVKVFPMRGAIILSTGHSKEIKYRNTINWFLGEIGMPLEVILGKDGELYLENRKTKTKTKFIEGMPVFMSGRQLAKLIDLTGNEFPL